MPNEFVTRRPQPSLRPFVARYIGYRQDGVTMAVHRGMPSRHVTLAISLAEPIRFLEPDAKLQAALGGLHTSSVLMAQDAYQCGVQLELNPLGVQSLFGASATDLSGVVIELADLGRPALRELPERLHDARSWSSRFAVLDEVLSSSLTDARDGRPEVLWAWRRMVADGGVGPVGALAAEVGWSSRHFAERFRAELGLSPKQAARVVRFDRARTALLVAPRTPLAELAADCGFYDQAHLSNEWRALAGCSPGTWLAEEVPHLSAEAGVDPAA